MKKDIDIFWQECSLPINFKETMSFLTLLFVASLDVTISKRGNDPGYFTANIASSKSKE